MGQTNQTVNNLVAKAHRMIGEFDPQEVIPANYITDGIEYLNDLINSYSENAYLIPLIKRLNFNTVQGQDRYTFSNQAIIQPDIGPAGPPDVVSNRLTSIEYLQLQFENEGEDVIWALREVTRTNLDTNTLLNKAGTIPGVFILEPSELFSTIRLYPIPDRAFIMTLQAKFYLDKFEDSQLLTNIPLGMQTFLQWALARYLLNFFPGGVWTDKSEDEYQKLHSERMAGTDIDLTSQPVNFVGYKDNRYNGIGLPILAG